jgi:hypothetical protein
LVDRLFPELHRFRGVLRLLCWEAAFVITFDTLVGPTYLSGLAGELKIDLGLVSALAAIPWIGASGQVFGAWAFERNRSVKRYVLALAGAGRALWAVPLLAAAWWGARARWHGAPFPVTRWFLLAALCACLSSLLTSASANAWLYWMRTLVPGRFQGRFFACRSRFSTIAFTVASLAAASLVGWVPQGYRLGSAALCGMALVAGGLAIWLHSRVPDVPLPDAAAPGRPRPLREILREPLGDPEFRRLLRFGAAFNGAMQLASSYFPYYFTRELRIPMSQIALWSALANLGCFLSATYWGSRVDRPRATTEVLWWTGHAVALSPLLYCLGGAAYVLRIAPFDYLTNGIVWAGFTLAQTKWLLRSCPRGRGAAYFSVYAAAGGLSGAVCTFLGGHLAGWLAPWGGFRALFLLTTLTRLSVLWMCLKPMRAVQRVTGSALA